MSTSLPILPGLGAVPKAIQDPLGNIQSNHNDTSGQGGFGALLGGLHTALPESLPPAAPVDVIAGELIQELQELPDGGKLLPLLQETLDAAVAQGMNGQQVLDSFVYQHSGIQPGADFSASEGIENPLFLNAPVSPGQGSQQFLDRLSASLKSLQPAQVQQVAQSLSGLTQQLTGQIPVLAGNAAAESAVFPAPGKADTVMPQGPMAELLQQQMRPQTGGSQLPASPDAMVSRQTLNETLPPAPQTSLDRVFEQLQQQPQPQASGVRQSDLAVLMAAFRRADRVQGAANEAARSDLAAISAGNAALAVTGPAGQLSPALPATSVQTPLGHANWGQDVGERVQWMVSQKMQGAQVKLNPANLGPMEVRVQVQNDQASVQFTAHNVVVREALEAALPRLRDMFEASGVELVDVDVSGQSFAEQQASTEDADGNNWNKGATDAEAAPEIMLESALTPPGYTGRLDLFA